MYHKTEVPYIGKLSTRLQYVEYNKYEVCGQDGVRQGCVLSPYFYNMLVEMVMKGVLEGYEGGFQIDGRRVTIYSMLMMTYGN